MNKIFPINEYPQKRYDETRAAFRRLVEKNWDGTVNQLLETPALVIETFAGMGGQTRILAERFPRAVMKGWEKDQFCFDQITEVLRDLSGSYYDYSQGEFPVSYFDEVMPKRSLHPVLLVVDGAYSLAQHDDYEKYHDPRAEYLIICEQARTRLHLHTKTYGLDPSLRGLELYEEYLEKVADRHGRPLLGFEPTPYSPCYVLLGPLEERN